ncbi:hypothetical protein OHS33_21910 [Streptomyces sp. NBC_00536]|uniref:DUF7848 domain-containing protein n=1 Tax=Streptomyces sp. NBC_00536 TaxID=2975769 RepID=UPI002E815229|nr:hypothetical protein [Streptomyces sp. NBC_00536]WUC80749.1 hypothetical protein OHS33_21910 [Streptomyces sp. NBC_00536]
MLRPRAAFRYVAHTIRHAPEGGVTYEVFCAAYGCGAESGAQGEQEAAQDWALRHAGRTGHDLFRRVYTDHARVTRADEAASQHPNALGTEPDKG